MPLLTQAQVEDIKIYLNNACNHAKDAAKASEIGCLNALPVYVRTLEDEALKAALQLDCSLCTYDVDKRWPSDHNLAANEKPVLYLSLQRAEYLLRVCRRALTGQRVDVAQCCKRTREALGAIHGMFATYFADQAQKEEQDSTWEQRNISNQPMIPSPLASTSSTLPSPPSSNEEGTAVAGPSRRSTVPDSSPTKVALSNGPIARKKLPTAPGIKAIEGQSPPKKRRRTSTNGVQAADQPHAKTTSQDPVRKSKNTERERARGARLEDDKIGVRATIACQACQKEPERCRVARNPVEFNGFKCGFCISSKRACSFDISNTGVAYAQQVIDEARSSGTGTKKAEQGKAKDSSGSEVKMHAK